MVLFILYILWDNNEIKIGENSTTIFTPKKNRRTYRFAQVNEEEHTF